MKNFVILTLVLAFLTGCDETGEEMKMNIFGAMAVQNKTSKKLNRISIVTDGMPNDFGILVAGGTATMGGGRFDLGKELKVVWTEDYGSENPTKGEAFFDTTKFADIAPEIKEVEFVYVGNKKWKIRAYKALHRYDKDLILELDSN